jgi:hypothetical protein
MGHKAILTIMVLVFLSASHASGGEEKMTITTPAFEHNGNIPSKHTCDGNNVNPHLKFSGIPAGAKKLALIVDDPDAPSGMFVHWVVWNIDPATTEIKEDSVPKEALEGITDYKKPGYKGPCPPSGTHRYFFKLYALDTELKLGTASTKADLEKAMKGHILAQSEIIGLYKKK